MQTITTTTVKKTKPAPAKAARPIPSERPHKELTPVQEQVADLCSQLILTGGRRQEVIPLLAALYRHQYVNKSFFGGKWQTGEQWDTQVSTQAAQWAEDAYRNLVRQWPSPKEESNDKKTTTGTNSSPGTIKTIVQTDLRSRLRNRFDRFLSDTEGIEAIWCLNEILEIYEAKATDLSEAIADVIDGSKCYIRVHWKDAEKVKEFAGLLRDRQSADREEA